MDSKQCGPDDESFIEDPNSPLAGEHQDKNLTEDHATGDDHKFSETHDKDSNYMSLTSEERETQQDIVKLKK